MKTGPGGFTADDITALSPEGKIAVVCTTDSEGRPHLTMLSSLLALSENEMALGEFCVGLSKSRMQERKDVGFFIMTLDRRIWGGSARWTGLTKEGPVYRQFNEKPMFRYNSYFGINTVHFFDLVSLDRRGTLPLARTAVGVSASLPLRLGGLAGRGGAMTPWTRKFLARPDVLKFAGFVSGDGTLTVEPVLEATSFGSGHVLVPEFPWSNTLRSIRPGAPVAILGLSMNMEMVLVRGPYQPHRIPGGGISSIEVDFVYNSMPPCHGQIFPRVPLESVSDFRL
mgnify:FL=1